MSRFEYYDGASPLSIPHIHKLMVALLLACIPVSLGVAQEPTTQPVDAQPQIIGETDLNESSETEPAPTDIKETEAIIDTSAGDAQAFGDQSDASGSTSLGWWTLLPAFLAIVLAVVTRQVIPALAIAILVGAYMLVFTVTDDIPATYDSVAEPIRGLRVAIEVFLIGALADSSHIQVILFTLMIGAMVGIVGGCGGTRALVQSVSKWASSSQRGQILGWLAGLVVFFDDYANTMIVGPTMGPVCDRLKISRQKLAYIVDSTAAPVASLALVGTWIGAEIGYIQLGLGSLGDAMPSYLADVSAYEVFLYSIPYRFYAIFALVMVALVGMTGRDFGPMKRAERRVYYESSTQATGLQDSIGSSGQWWYAGVPVILLVVVTISILVISGWQGRDAQAFADMTLLQQAGEILHNADAYLSILYGALSAMVFAAAIAVGTRTMSVGRCVEAGTEGMKRMFAAVVVLVLAWTLSQIMLSLQVPEFAAAFLRDMDFDPKFLPLAIFLCAAVVSFSTGTSWGTMGILCPATVHVAAGLIADMPADSGAAIFYAAVGSVLAGAVFGDHCSPISDTTVLSASATECSLESHVWTQLPYAMVTAIVAVGCGDLLCAHYGQPWWIGWLAGIAALIIVVFLVGRRAVPKNASVSAG